MRRDDLETAGARGEQCFSSIECLAYLDARDGAPVAEVFQRHLDACERCRVLVAETAREVYANGAASGGPSSLRTFKDGDVLGGRYEIRRFIARGGMGEVYEAFDQTLGERIALKTLSPTMLDQPQATSALIAEVRLARKVMHPNVCRIFEFSLHRRSTGEGEVIPFLTMELLEGETLTSRLRRDGSLSPPRALQVLRELTEGLAAVHRAGIVHRDFKADNVFLARAGEGATERAVVMDFGLARALDINRGSRRSSAHALVGTIAYMAPEQVEGARPTPGFDVYALGTVAFELLCGRLPFVAESQLALATLRLRHEPPRPSSLRAGLTPVWDWFISSCLARAPGSRLGSMDAVARALGRIEAGETVPLSRYLARIHRPVVAASAIAFFLAGGALAGYRALSRPESRAPLPAVAPTLPPQAAAAVPLPVPLVPPAVPPVVQEVDAGRQAEPTRVKRSGGQTLARPSRKTIATSAPDWAHGPPVQSPAPHAPAPSDDDFIDPFSHLRAPSERGPQPEPSLVEGR